MTATPDRLIQLHHDAEQLGALRALLRRPVPLLARLEVETLDGRQRVQAELCASEITGRALLVGLVAAAEYETEHLIHVAEARLAEEPGS
jgi:hypothetical protein